MDFLNKLYESNYFGIGLFAVISFLVVTFLVVLFFGKKDEQKRKLENSYDNSKPENDINAFKETTMSVPLEIPVAPKIEEPIALVTPVEPVAPINFEQPPVVPVAPIEPVPIINPIETPISEPIVTPTASIEMPTVSTTPVTPIINEPVSPIVEPVTVEPMKFSIPTEPVAPKTMEPIKIVIPDEPVVTPTPVSPVINESVSPIVEPIIKEEVTPIVTPSYDNFKPIIEEPTVSPTYYQPVEPVKAEEVNVPKIDFDAIAKSISKELDELEKSTVNNNYEEIKVTPMREISTPSVNTNPSQIQTPISTPVGANNQFSSVYVAPQPKVAPVITDLPKKIDLPTKKNDDI